MLSRKKSEYDFMQSGYDLTMLRSAASEYDLRVSENFSIKGESIYEERVRNFGEEITLLELDH
jgi:hypothetical protein